MDKRAQKRDRLHKLREKIDFFGKATEAFSPTFGALMDKLREADEKVRESLLEEDPKLKDVLKSAKTNFNRREYMTAIGNLKTFHDKMDAVVKILKELKLDVDEAHNDFIFKDLDTDTISNLKSLKQKFEDKKAARRNELLVKEAGLGDLWHLLTSERGKAIREWEKRYPGKMKELKNRTNSLVRKSESLFAVLLVCLKDMSQARGARNLDKYVKAAGKLIAKYDEYNAEFKEFYKSNINGFVEKLLAQEAKKEEAKQVKTEETGLGEQSVAPESGPDSTPMSSPFVPSPGSQNFDPASLKGESPSSSRRSGPADSERWQTPASEYGDADPSKVDPYSKTLPSPKMEPVPESESPLTPVPPAVRTPPQSSGMRSKAPVDYTNPEIPKAPRVPQDLIPSSVRRELQQQQQDKSTNPAGLLAVKAPDTIPASKWEQVPDTDREQVASETVVDPSSLFGPSVRSAHPLLRTLQVLSSESPEVLALEINKYATSIQKTDPQTSRKLFAIVERILNGK